MYNWQNIEKQEDIDLLMSTYGYFHDSCLALIKYESGISVDENMSMNFNNAEKYILSAVFQRQWHPKTIEMQFIGVRQLHLAGWQDNYLGDILGAYLKFHYRLLPGKPERVIVWADYDDFDPSMIEGGIHEPNDTYIVANALRWKIIEE